MSRPRARPSRTTSSHGTPRRRADSAENAPTPCRTASSMRASAGHGTALHGGASAASWCGPRPPRARYTSTIGTSYCMTISPKRSVLVSTRSTFTPTSASRPGAVARSIAGSPSAELQTLAKA